jgi:hypothetical protein
MPNNESQVILGWGFLPFLLRDKGASVEGPSTALSTIPSAGRHCPDVEADGIKEFTAKNPQPRQNSKKAFATSSYKRAYVAPTVNSLAHDCDTCRSSKLKNEQGTRNILGNFLDVSEPAKIALPPPIPVHHFGGNNPTTPREVMPLEAKVSPRMSYAERQIARSLLEQRMIVEMIQSPGKLSSAEVLHRMTPKKSFATSEAGLSRDLHENPEGDRKAALHRETRTLSPRLQRLVALRSARAGEAPM